MNEYSTGIPHPLSDNQHQWPPFDVKNRRTKTSVVPEPKTTTTTCSLAFLKRPPTTPDRLYPDDFPGDERGENDHGFRPDPPDRSTAGEVADEISIGMPSRRQNIYPLLRCPKAMNARKSTTVLTQTLHKTLFTTLLAFHSIPRPERGE